MEDSEEFHEPGSIFWAKVGSHPWWPCMIYFSPDGEGYYRSRGRVCTYHVQFLGPLVERAWVSNGNLIPFYGKKKFDEHVRNKLDNCKDKNERNKFDSKSTCSSREIWMQSWKEAESAMHFTLKKRIEKFGRINVAVKSRRISKSEEESLIKMISNVPLTVEEEAESLSNFLKKELDVRTSKDPTIDTKLLEEELRTQWPGLDIPTKRIYLEKQLGIFEADRSTRKSKSSITSIVSEQAEGIASSGKQNKKSIESSTKRDMENQEFDIEIHRLIVSPAQYRLQPVCPACEVYSSAPGQMFKCRGPCGRMMHPSCMRYKVPPPAENNRPDRFRCPQCLTNEFLCGICGKPSDESKGSQLGTLIQCRFSSCARYFHRDCVADWPGVTIRSNATESKGTRHSNFQLLRCPAHTCNTCYLEDTACQDSGNSTTAKSSNDTAKPFLKCVRCPAIFHTGDLCTPAGSVEVSLSHIVCPRHFDEPLNTMSHFRAQHPNWCFKCFTSSGERVFCNFCPRNYHTNCLESSLGQQTGDTFTCRSCRQGFFPRYAQIVWAKIPHFRWWPCEVIHARNAPINILNMAHPEGTFPIRFLGSDEYQWISKCCVLPYETGLKTSAAKDYHGTKSVDKAFTRALARAPKAHQVYVNHVLKCGLSLVSMHAEPLPDDEMLPSLCTSKATTIETTDAVVLHDRLRDQLGPDTAVTNFSSLLTNIYATEDKAFLDKVAGINTDLAPGICTCATASATCATRGEQCENIHFTRECESSNCSWKNKDCGNRLFALLQTKPEADRVGILRTVNRGYGLKSLIPVKKGDLVTEYRGEVIDVDEANRRILDALGPAALANLSSSRKGCRPERETYLARLGSQRDFVLDASSRGSMSRFINHSCEPNLMAKCWLVKGRPRLGMFAIRPIAVNEELTVHYSAAQFLSTGLMGATCLCLCGTDSCVSTLRLSLAYEPLSDGTNNSDVTMIENDAADHRRRQSRKSTLTADQSTSIVSAGNSTKSTMSVVSLLAAATNATTRRNQRPLIQPTVIAARAAAAAKQKTPGTMSEYTDVSLVPSTHASPHEDFCYRCGDGGELVLCDKSTCSKSYHLHCLGLGSPPTGIWYCPWHYCDVCGHPSSHLCWRCPNSYCHDHANNKVIQVDDLDRMRWEAAKSSMESMNTSNTGHSAIVSTVPVLVSSFHWICSDHVGINIHGPGHRPWLSEPPSSHGEANKNTDVHCSTNTDTSMVNHSGDDENVAPASTDTVNQSDTALSSDNNEKQSEEIRRLEPLKVTLKRRLKAELAVTKGGQDSLTDSVLHPNQNECELVASTPTLVDSDAGITGDDKMPDSLGDRKRLASTDGSSVVHKKRQRISSSSSSK